MGDLMLDVGLANELKMSFRRNGWTAEEIKKATKGDFLAKARHLLLGHAEIVVPEHIINLDADPYVPLCSSIEEHEAGGQFIWDPAQVALHRVEKQQEDERIDSSALWKELKSKSVFNAKLLDYLVERPHLIPSEWTKGGKFIFFLGTIYRYLESGELFVRGLGWYSANNVFWLGRELDQLVRVPFLSATRASE